jgi:hypothetical protein
MIRTNPRISAMGMRDRQSWGAKFCPGIKRGIKKIVSRKKMMIILKMMKINLNFKPNAPIISTVYDNS